ncbi:hypothetical protein PQ465_13675 [Sphingobacterium oryzagri]|uniref:Uncharacterized protein n=1 Tax=Sphingobacterium oryzagri TaxID=3025669 RepID=A0ABY7WD10_9SPHI|nr:hypothetical protein [Sphingobacterium sp. KACC 22765]WDF67355.1 hypothetical protein PQ465_13675 [Sphingobacterium sp. KACC 22765]
MLRIKTEKSPCGLFSVLMRNVGEAAQTKNFTAAKRVFLTNKQRKEKTWLIKQ